MDSEIRILSIAAGGDGVGKLSDGRAVFVPRAAPEDVIEPAGLRLHDRFARARIARVVTPGPGRVTPSCPHYVRDECGGCQLQHLDMETQLSAKRSIVGEALRRIGRVEIDDPHIVPSDEQWGYRSKLTLAVAPGGRIIGLHRYDRATEVFDLEHCLITAPPLMELWREVRKVRRLLPRTASTLVLRLDRSAGRHLVVRVVGQTVWREAKELHRQLAAAGVAATIWWVPEGGAPRVVAGSTEAFPATVFEQVHPSLGDRIRRFAVDQLGETDACHVWDLYAGIGETTTLVAARGASVESVELDSRAVEQAERGSHPGNRIRRYVGRVEEFIGRLKRPDLVIANPPREGMDAAVTRGIRTARPARVVYVSCDAATLARDLARLTQPAADARYLVTGVHAFDLFPQTAHVETVTVLEAA